MDGHTDTGYCRCISSILMEFGHMPTFAVSVFWPSFFCFCRFGQNADIPDSVKIFITRNFTLPQSHVCNSTTHAIAAVRHRHVRSQRSIADRPHIVNLTAPESSYHSFSYACSIRTPTCTLLLYLLQSPSGSLPLPGFPPLSDTHCLCQASGSLSS